MAKLLRFPGVQVKTGGLSRTTIWRLERDGLFPKRRLLTGKIVAWDEAEIDEWIKSRIQEVGPAPSRHFKDFERKADSRMNYQQKVPRKRIAAR
jgi:prophage regulatory protein